MNYKILILSVISMIFLCGYGGQSDGLSMPSLNRIMIDGLVDSDVTNNIDIEAQGLANTSVLNPLLIKKLQFDPSHTAHLEFPCGTYYFGRTISFQLIAYLDYTLTIRIPSCTTIKATSGIVNTNLFLFKSSNNQNLADARVCLYGGNQCSPTDQTLGGTIDTSEASHKTSKLPRSSNINTINGKHLNTLIVQGLNFTGFQSKSDTFIVSDSKNIRVRHNRFNRAADAAVYLSGVEYQGTERTNQAIIWGNNIQNTLSGVVCKRGYKYCDVSGNSFSNNNSAIACVRVTDDSANPYPCRRLVATENQINGGKSDDGSSWAQGVLLDNCNENCIVERNNISGHINMDNKTKTINCDVRLYNSSNAFVAYNAKASSSAVPSHICDEGSQPKGYGEGNVLSLASDNNVIIERSPYKNGTPAP